ncbi:MAG: hypothetical protein JWO56_3516 [Acidobacteria bacterium]|nr:hypothetical protein [Acidobacteriota bacterium]
MTIMMMLLLALADAPDPATCPMHAAHAAARSAGHGDGHSEAVDRRGDEAMGFSHQTAGHHFPLFADGGAITAAANDDADAKTIAAIRAHLQQVATAFAAGDFAKPLFIHGTTPDGVAVMQKLRDRISFVYEETPAGARVRIRTADASALDAVHRFLRFQIDEHRTGDDPGVVAEK